MTNKEKIKMKIKKEMSKTQCEENEDLIYKINDKYLCINYI